MTTDRCPSCDNDVIIMSSDEGTQSYKPRISARALGVETKACSICGDSLCMEKYSGWPKEHPYPPECDLWTGHPGMHRHMSATRIREDIVWGEGEATWEHGSLFKTIKFTAYGPHGSQEVPSFYYDGQHWSVEDLVPDGAEEQLGEWTITTRFDPKGD